MRVGVHMDVVIPEREKGKPHCGQEDGQGDNRHNETPRPRGYFSVPGFHWVLSGTERGQKSIPPKNPLFFSLLLLFSRAFRN
jgi:hypothetical protein